MRVYHERLWVPLSWWLAGLGTVVLLGAFLVAGFGWLAAAASYAALAGTLAALLLRWSLTPVDVAGRELRAGRARLPLASAGEVSPLDRAQARAMRGRHADPAAFLLIRPYLQDAVYVQVTDPQAGTPYWLVATRRPAELAAAIGRSRPATRAGGAAVG